MNSEFWRHQLTDVDSPFVHFVPPNWLDVDGLRSAAQDLGFASFLADLQGVRSESALIAALAKAMHIPIGGGDGWDYLLDSMTDLSWVNANGYVLIVGNAETLLPPPEDALTNFLVVAEATIRNWRDERGEYGERTGPVMFHLILSGNEAAREAILGHLKEPLCDHRSESSVEIMRIPGAIGRDQSFQKAHKLMQAGADLEMALVFLRERGFLHLDTVYATAALTGKSIPESRALVDQSQTWSTELREQSQRLRQWARDTLIELGLDEDDDLPKTDN